MGFITSAGCTGNSIHINVILLEGESTQKVQGESYRSVVEYQLIL